jgi:Flp pilus assembly pilin Flp
MFGKRARRGLNAEKGATVEEYALMVTFVAVVVTTILVQFGPALAGLFAGAPIGL